MIAAASAPAVRVMIATGVAALGEAVFGFSQPFLAVIAAYLLTGFSISSPREWGIQLGASWLGIALGLILLVATPQQPWLSLPLFGGITALGGVRWLRRGRTDCALVFGIGMAASVGAGWLASHRALPAIFAHAGSLALAVFAAGFASWVISRSIVISPSPSVERRPVLPPASGISLGLSSVFALFCSALFLPHSMVPLIIAAITTAVALPAAASSFEQLRLRALGALLGSGVSVVFLILVNGAGNNFAVFLCALIVVFAVGETVANLQPKWALSLRQALAVFAVAAPILPGPVALIESPLLRIIGILFGFSLSALLYGLLAMKKTAPAPLGG